MEKVFNYIYNEYIYIYKVIWVQHIREIQIQHIRASEKFRYFLGIFKEKEK